MKQTIITSESISGYALEVARPAGCRRYLGICVLPRGRMGGLGVASADDGGRPPWRLQGGHNHGDRNPHRPPRLWRLSLNHAGVVMRGNATTGRWIVAAWLLFTGVVRSASIHTESFSSGAAGWLASGSLQVAAVDETLRGQFAAQTFPFPESGAFVATNTCFRVYYYRENVEKST